MSPSAPRLRNRFPRELRLRGSRQFARLKERGQRRVCGCLILNWQALEAGGRTRVGVITSRHLGGAVVRNRARRMIREAFRLHQHQLKVPLQLILVARSSLVGRPLSGVIRDLRRGLSEAGLWVDPPAQEPTPTSSLAPPSPLMPPCERSS